MGHLKSKANKYKILCCFDMSPSFLDLLILVLFCTRKQRNFLLVDMVAVEHSNRKECI